MIFKSPSAHQIALGIDVHNLDNDGNTIDWQLVKNSNISFAFAKATEGANWTDNKFDSNWQGMKQAGLIRGAFHFFRANKTAEEQAANFLKKVKNGLEFNDLPPVLDVELADKDPEGKEWKFIASLNQERSVSQRLDLVRHWLQKVEEATGRRPIIYTNINFWKEFMDDSTELTEYPLWIANHTSKSQLKIPANNWGGKGYTIWQNTENGSVNDVSGHVDRNRFNGLSLFWVRF